MNFGAADGTEGGGNEFKTTRNMAEWKREKAVSYVVWFFGVVWGCVRSYLPLCFRELDYY